MAVQGQSESRLRGIVHHRGGREVRLAWGGILDAFMMRSWVTQQGLGLVASRWLGAGKGRAMGRND